ncbi:MAG: Fic family protein [Butyrivibrio sp.]|nr:Fic family protein [Butyrivibrio sp.]
MPIVSKNNESLNSRDLNAIKAMIKQSLEAHVTFLNEDYEKNTSKSVKKSKEVLLETFKNATVGVDAAVDKANKNKKNIQADEFIDKFYSNLMADIAGALNKIEMSKGETSYAQGFITDFGIKPAREFAESKFHVEDSDEGYDFTEKSFELPNKPIKGIEKINDYNPDTDRVQVLYEARSGNSTTLESSVEAMKEQLEKISENDKIERDNAEKNLQQALSSTAGLHAGGEMARIYSSKLMRKDNISFADMYEVLIGLNKTVRIGDKGGGTFRAEGIMAGKLYGVGSFTESKVAYKTLSKIAKCMNDIRKTEDPALRKTQAIYLASYAYLMTISEHLFLDGNGRTCRLLSDTILQTFGLPPHTPLPDIREVSKTIGREKIDFDKGAQIIFDGVKLSNDALQKEKEETQKEKESKIVQDEVKPISFEALELKSNHSDDNRINGNPAFMKGPDPLEKLISLNEEKKTDEIKKKENVKGSADIKYTNMPAAPNLNNITQLTWLKNLSTRAEEAKGRLFDSEKYNEFYNNTIIVSELAKQIAKKRGLSMGEDAIINISNFDKKAQDVIGAHEGIITVRQAQERYVEAWNKLVKSAQEYETYKIQNQGFTRDVNDKAKHQLRSRSKQKFELMDEIFDPEKRTTSEAENSKGISK